MSPLEPESDLAGLAPNLEEWREFWGEEPRPDMLIDARDLAFDGPGPRQVDWSYRAQRWVAERGPQAPNPEDVAPGYSVERFDGGWLLYDEVLGRPAMIVRA